MTNPVDTAQLEKLRSEIDALDDKLAGLISERLTLVRRAAALKSELKSAAYSQSREAFLQQHGAALEDKYELPTDLMADLLKRIVRESYRTSGGKSFACVKSTERPLVIVGGQGGMGRLFLQYFKASGYNALSLDKDDWDRAPEILGRAMTVIISVPIDLTEEIIKKTAAFLPEDCLLCDFTSVKAPALNTMLEAWKGPVLGLHPMFGPDIRSMVKQVIVACPGRDEGRGQFMLEQFRQWGAKVCECSAVEHDKAMSIIQALRHFTTYCYGIFMAGIHPDLKQILDLSSPIYRLELEMVGRLFAQDPHLYCDIIMSSQQNIELISDYAKSLQQELEHISRCDKKTFVKHFLQAREYFGDYAGMFLRESGALLAKVQDER
ncbi:MAG: bifunctional chorismate mutase/prephenate dehydrogenase [Proteobacteria bacterium]|uniref:T-protein n=1 Tax=Candidatus Avisuccinivibrio stercorigallinarum TaxID=2840704 RepID=A0A9D9DG75_9GAMM|nr:bifunctional chorismate mutase/prephenate dehydrogenase [Candidatus Avisuccinivibrio stercorigallinarum]